MNAEIKRPRPLFIYGPLGATMISVDQALVCPGCRRATFNFVNRDGRTLCTRCDLPRQKEHELREEKQSMADGRRSMAGDAA